RCGGGARGVGTRPRACSAGGRGEGGRSRPLSRPAHAEKPRREPGRAVEPVTFAPPEPQGANDALTYRDPSGQPLAPRLPPPPIDGPDVRLKPAEFEARQNAANAAPGARTGLDKRGGGGVGHNKAIDPPLMYSHLQ